MNISVVIIVIFRSEPVDFSLPTNLVTGPDNLF